MENLYSIFDYLGKMVMYLNNLGVQNLDKFVNMVYSNLLKYAKSTEPNLSDKVRFVLKEKVNEDIPISAICEVNIISANKPKTVETNPGAKKGGKKQTQTKAVYEYDYYEKSPYLPFCSENNCKILCYSLNFERMIRYNILDCVHKLYKIDDLDKENFMKKLEDSYKEIFIKPFINELATDLNKDIISFDIDLTEQPPQ